MLFCRDRTRESWAEHNDQADREREAAQAAIDFLMTPPVMDLLAKQLQKIREQPLKDTGTT